MSSRRTTSQKAIRRRAGRADVRPDGCANPTAWGEIGAPGQRTLEALVRSVADGSKVGDGVAKHGGT
jgi:hypothetical protein